MWEINTYWICRDTAIRQNTKSTPVEIKLLIQECFCPISYNPFPSDIIAIPLLTNYLTSLSMKVCNFPFQPKKQLSFRQPLYKMVLGYACLGDIFQGRIDLIARLEIEVLGLIGLGRQGDTLDSPRLGFHLQLFQKAQTQAPTSVFFLDNQGLDMGCFQSLRINMGGGFIQD